MGERNRFEDSFRATQSIGAFLVAAVPATTTAFNAELADTSTSQPLGITQDVVSTNGAVAIVTMGRSLGLCSASISAGSLVGWETATGELVAVVNNTTSATNILKTIGIALQAGSTNSTIEIFVNPSYIGNAV